MEMNFRNFNVLVVYDNFKSGCRAMSLLNRLAGQSGAPGVLTYVMFRFDLLGEVSFFELAVSQALTADLLVIATSEEQSLPQCVHAWLAQWLLRKENAPQALVATFDYHPSKLHGPRRVSADLATLAGYGNVPFFSNEGDQARVVNFGWVEGNEWALDSALVRPQAAGPN